MLIFLALIVFPQQVSSRLSAILSIACPPLVEASENTNFAFSCRVTNRDTESVFVLVTPLVLEGPTHPESSYIYYFVAGQRTENVLQYGRGKNAVLDLPVLFKPAVHLRLQDFSQFIKIAPEESREFAVLWHLNEADLPYQGDWSARIKLVFLARGAIERIMSRRLSPVCDRALRLGLAKGERSLPYRTINVIRPLGPRGYKFDGCRDVVSEATDHAYSNEFHLRVSNGEGRK